MKRPFLHLLSACLLVALTGCLFDDGVPAPEPDPLTLAREYSGLWVPDDARVLKYEDSFYGNGRMRRQGLLELIVQLTPADYGQLAAVAAARGYQDLESRREMPADSLSQQDAYPFPLGTAGLYLITQGHGPNSITVLLQDETHTLHLEMVQLSFAFFDTSSTDTIIKRYACGDGKCSVEPIGWPEVNRK